MINLAQIKSCPRASQKMHMACWENGNGGDGRGKGERTKKKVYVISTAKKKKMSYGTERVTIKGVFCPTSAL